MQVVERRREQAAEVVGRCLEQAAEEARSRPAQAIIHHPVIPAQAGIQWFRQAIPARRE